MLIIIFWTLWTNLYIANNTRTPTSGGPTSKIQLLLYALRMLSSQTRAVYLIKQWLHIKGKQKGMSPCLKILNVVGKLVIFLFLLWISAHISGNKTTYKGMVNTVVGDLLITLLRCLYNSL